MVIANAMLDRRNISIGKGHGVVVFASAVKIYDLLIEIIWIWIYGWWDW
jgi:hypothetical protein